MVDLPFQSCESRFARINTRTIKYIISWDFRDNNMNFYHECLQSETELIERSRLVARLSHTVSRCVVSPKKFQQRTTRSEDNGRGGGFEDREPGSEYQKSAHPASLQALLSTSSFLEREVGRSAMSLERLRHPIRRHRRSERWQIHVD